MPEVVSHCDRFDKVFVEPYRAPDRPCDLRHFEGVRKARSVMIAFGRQENLRLVFQPPERFAVNNSVAVALKLRADFALFDRSNPSRRVATFERVGAQISVLDFVRYVLNVVAHCFSLVELCVFRRFRQRYRCCRVALSTTLLRCRYTRGELRLARLFLRR